MDSLDKKIEDFYNTKNMTLNILKELLENNPHAKKEVLVQWVKMRSSMRPREDYASLKGLTLDQIKTANFNSY